ncbi:PREDICTED: lipopolysaccharide-induced tumor necrosis factor-alpha factor homolog [Dinoponera quadriceps]|uniref:Lipopolysaccharide-induced tumor necrosis factor-alpha factor homolog n=1 Tax=Dinoponera quadriceps TaxID=609295 RepID=A0A6P3Y5H3_DINQU|nr:PREDICTED: lipopolysaccharide-induced tumor necrosis factor-alpha factor homolog [Dinoponera quadriceps]XP_014486126.1 PREDICTED: lipopolysaccharide-induced tumor necrosis factor-alpha factor homolog [Dinoponera quadriceps]
MDKNAHPPPPGFAPPPPYDAQQQQQQAQPQMIVVTGGFGPETQRMTCPQCHANISTRVETESNTKTHIMAILLCVFFCWCCAPCPYCIDSCLVKKHYCPSCGAYLGSCDN